MNREYSNNAKDELDQEKNKHNSDTNGNSNFIDPVLSKNKAVVSGLMETLNKTGYANMISPYKIIGTNLTNQIVNSSLIVSSAINSLNTTVNIQHAYQGMLGQIVNNTPTINQIMSNEIIKNNFLKDIVHPEKQMIKSINVMAKSFKDLSDVRNIIANEMRKSSELLNKTLLSVNSANRSFIRENILFNKLINLNWTWGFCFEDEDIFNFYDKSEKEIDDAMVSYYRKDNYSNLFDEIESTIDYLNKINGHGFADQYALIMELLQKDFTNFRAIVPSLFGILTFIFDYQHNFLNVETSARKDIAENFKNKNSNVMKSMSSQTMRATSAVFCTYYSRVTFADGPEKVGFGRHSVQHGRYDPDRYKEKDIMKLIVVISAMQEFDVIE